MTRWTKRLLGATLLLALGEWGPVRAGWAEELPRPRPPAREGASVTRPEPPRAALREALLGKPPALQREDLPYPRPPRPTVTPKRAKPWVSSGTALRNGVDLKAFYADSPSGAIAPRNGLIEASSRETQGSGRDDEAVSRTVSEHQPAFQYCIDQELRINPGFRGEKIFLIATVNASGVVKKANIDRREVDLSELGRCLKSKARKMAFAPADDEAELQIPLILGQG